MSLLNISTQSFRSSTQLLQYLLYKSLGYQKPLRRWFSISLKLLPRQYQDTLSQWYPLKEYLESHPELFPMKFLGSGSQAYAFKTARGTALRIRLPSDMPSYTEEYYQQCANTTTPEEWMPVVHFVKTFESKKGIGSITEMELLGDFEDSTLYRYHRKTALSVATRLRYCKRSCWPEVRKMLAEVKSFSEGNNSDIPVNALKVMGFACFDTLSELQSGRGPKELQEILEQHPAAFSRFKEVIEATVNAYAINTKSQPSDPTIDLHTGNIMFRRKSNQLVVIDPLY